MQIERRAGSEGRGAPSKGCDDMIPQIRPVRPQRQKEARGGGELLLIAFIMFCLFGLPRIMYAVIAPMKGWC